MTDQVTVHIEGRARIQFHKQITMSKEQAAEFERKLDDASMREADELIAEHLNIEDYDAPEDFELDWLNVSEDKQ